MLAHISKGRFKIKRTTIMKQSFEIKFDFPLAHSNLVFQLTAVAESHHSELYYVVDHFHFNGVQHPQEEISILPPQEIKKILIEGKNVWVHKDSERESRLSISMGKAIENALMDGTGTD